MQYVNIPARMLQEVPLPFTPSVANCMTWSTDGELAIATGEYVHILVCSNSKTLGYC